MRKIFAMVMVLCLLLLFGGMLTGCSSTTSGGAAAVEKATALFQAVTDTAIKMAPAAANIYLKDQVAKGKITQEQADMIAQAVGEMAAANAAKAAPAATVSPAPTPVK